jgi:hypothetical protein
LISGGESEDQGITDEQDGIAEIEFCLPPTVSLSKSPYLKGCHEDRTPSDDRKRNGK